MKYSLRSLDQSDLGLHININTDSIISYAKFLLYGTLGYILSLLSIIADKVVCSWSMKMLSFLPVLSLR